MLSRKSALRSRELLGGLCSDVVEASKSKHALALINRFRDCTLHVVYDSKTESEDSDNFQNRDDGLHDDYLPMCTTNSTQEGASTKAGSGGLD